MAMLSDRLAGMRYECRRALREIKPIMALAGAWGGRPPAEAVACIVLFLVGVPTEDEWQRYPQLHHADNDPVLPFHHLHHLAGEFYDEPTWRDPPPARERELLAIRLDLLTMQAQRVRLWVAELTPHHHFLMRFKAKVKARLQG